MKPFAIWAVGVVTAFAALAGVTTATRDAEQVFVVVDSSFEMDTVWSRVPAELDRIDDREYAEFAVATEKAPIHGYQTDIDFPAVDAFAPCSFDEIDRFPAAASADERILITTTANEALCPTTGLDGWTIIYLDR